VPSEKGILVTTPRVEKGGKIGHFEIIKVGLLLKGNLLSQGAKADRINYKGGKKGLFARKEWAA